MDIVFWGHKMGGMIDTLFGGGKEQAYKDLQNYINQGMGQRKDYEQRAEQSLSPYTGDPRIQKLFESELAKQQNPQEYYNSLFSGYSQSPFAKAQTEAGMNAIQHASAGSGMHGSGDELKALQENAQKISSADQQQYLNNLLGIRSDYMNRMGNLQSQESEHGYGARTNIANMLNQLGGNLAGDLGNVGKAKGFQDMAHAEGINKLISGLGGGLIGMGSGMGGGMGKFFQGLSDLF